jgi:hypothetical protein
MKEIPQLKLSPMNVAYGKCMAMKHSGFEIRRGNRKLPTKFKTIDEAEMALEIFNRRQRRRDDSQDYIDEA